jgi:hypothetical protein
MSTEANERFPAGPRGAKGDRGDRGLSRLQGRAIVVLFLIAALSGVGNLFWTAHEVHASTTAQRQEQAAQQRAGVVIEQKLCTTLGRLAVLKPPPGSPLTNPSRAYDQELHAALAQLSPDLGCR